LVKKNVVYHYQANNMSIKELAEYAQTSTRTINRILIEAGLATPVERIQGEAKVVMTLLKKHRVGPVVLSKILTDHAKQYVNTPISNQAQIPLDLQQKEQTNDKGNQLH
jgi:hypothetical protein